MSMPYVTRRVEQGQQAVEYIDVKMEVGTEERQTSCIGFLWSFFCECP